MNFTIKDEYLTDVEVRKDVYKYSGKTELTDEELLEVIRDPVLWTTVSHEDHPEFAKLRDQLESEGYIETQRNAWNGDKVLKPFKLNNIQFMTGDRFVSGAAMRGHLAWLKRDLEFTHRH